MAQIEEVRAKAEIDELRLVVAAQSKLLTQLVKYLSDAEPIERPVVLNEEELDELMEAVCEDLDPHLTRTYFPLAPQWLRMN